MPTHTSYVIDTSILSELYKDSSEQHLSLRIWLNQVPKDDLHVPCGVALEIERGIAGLRRSNPRKADQLEIWFEELMSSDLPFLPMTRAAVRLHAEMTSERALTHFWINDPRRKNPRPCQSLSIAATAIANKSCIVTRNVSAFEMIGRFFPLPGILNPIDQADVLDTPVSPTTFH
ncbi:PIN domain-containing protein [Roseibium alexandrii]|uniref:PIN domain-containing protein n=1 Tax=Roseibium alexandrii TaxID=388408 RepID=UPI003751F32C